MHTGVHVYVGGCMHVHKYTSRKRVCVGGCMRMCVCMCVQAVFALAVAASCLVSCMSSPVHESWSYNPTSKCEYVRALAVSVMGVLVSRYTKSLFFDLAWPARRSTGISSKHTQQPGGSHLSSEQLDARQVSSGVSSCPSLLVSR